MDKGMNLINAMNALTLAVAALTDKVTTEYLKTYETIYDPEKDEPQDKSKKEPKKEQPKQDKNVVSFVELRSRLAEISRNGHTSEIKELIAKHGAEKLSDVAEADYAALLAEAEAL